MKAVLILAVIVAINLLPQQPVKRPAHITCRIQSVEYGIAVLACRDDKTAEKFQWEVHEDNWPGVWGVNRHPGHIVRAGRNVKGDLIPACRVSQDCHPADQACLQTPLPANRTCDFHDELR